MKNSLATGVKGMQVSGIAAVLAASDGSVRMDGWSHRWTNDRIGAAHSPSSGVKFGHGASMKHWASLDKLSSVVFALTSCAFFALTPLSAGVRTRMEGMAYRFLALAITVIYLRNYLFGPHYIAAVLGRANAEEVHHELYQAS